MDGTDDFNEMQMPRCIAGLVYLYRKLVNYCTFYLYERIPKTECIIEATPNTGTY